MLFLRFRKIFGLFLLLGSLSPSVWALNFVAPNVVLTNTAANGSGPSSISFNISTLLKQGDTITVQFPNNTQLPVNMSVASVTLLQGASAITLSSIQVDQANRLVVMALLNQLTTSGTDSIVFATSADIVNPSCAGSYTLNLSTGAETTAITSPSYTITSATTSVNTVTGAPNPSVAGAQSEYQIELNLGTQGRLDTCSNLITVTFPAGTTVPNGALGGITVDNITASAVGNSASRTVVITSPLTLPNSSHVVLDIPYSVGIVNPSAGSVTLKLHTSVEGTDVDSSAYVVITPTTTLSAAYVDALPNVVGDAGDYLMDFVTSSSGALTGGSDAITITFPVGTTVPASISPSSVFVDNGTFDENPPTVTTIPAQRKVIITVPSNIPASQFVEIDFDTSAGILNPSTAGYYTTTLSTTKDGAQPSNSYQIVNVPTQISQPLVTVSPITTSVAALYTVSFVTGTEGQLMGGNDTLLLQFPAGTGVPNGSLSGILVNGTSATANGSTSASAVTVTVPNNLAPSSAVSITIPASAGVTNPANTTFYNMTASTTRETTGVLSAPYAIGVITSVTTVAVGLSNTTANASSAVTVTFTNTTKNIRTMAIYIDFPYNTGLPNSISTSNVLVNGITPTSVSVDPVARQVIVQDPTSHNPTTPVTVIIGTSTAVVQNPSIGGSNTLQVNTSVDNGLVTSSSYSIIGGATHITSPFVSVAPSASGVAGGYSISFNTGASGRMAPGSSAITLTFNSAYTLPSSISPSLVTVDGVAASAVSVNTGSKLIIITVPYSIQINGGDLVQLLISSAAGVTNPAAGSYTLNANTSVETSAQTSNSYTIDSGAALIVNGATVGTCDVNSNSSYNLKFTVGNAGALTANSSTIVVVFPSNSILPSTMAASDIKVNGNALNLAPSINTSSLSVTLTTPIAIANSGAVTVTFASSAGLVNPTLSGNYQLQVATSVQPTLKSSPSYSICAATTSVTNANVSLSSVTPSAAATYTINFNVGGEGSLITGTSTITLTLPSGTSVPLSPTASDVKVNGVSASSVSVSGLSLIVTVPAGVTITGNDAVTVKLTGTAQPTNPTAGTYSLTVKTSVETNAVASNLYTITGATPIGAPTVGVSPSTVNTAGAYGVTFLTGAGTSTPSGSTLTITFPYDTFVPSSISTTGFTLTATGVTTSSISAVSSNPALNQITLTISTSSSIGASATVTIGIPASAGILNPSVAGSYSLQVQTSVEPVNVTSNNYSITATSSTITAPFVLPSPNVDSAAAGYSVTFAVGADGRLRPGVSVIILNFPTGTTIPAFLSTAKVQVNGADADSTATNPATRAVTLAVPSSVQINNSGSVSISFASDAGLFNPSCGSVSLTAATSVEATLVNSSAYSIACATATPTPSPSPTSGATDTPTNTPTQSATSTPTNSATNSPTQTATSTPTNSATATATSTPTQSATSTATQSATSTPTQSATNSATDTATNTATNSATATATSTPTSTGTNTSTSTPTSSATNTSTASPSSTPTGTGTSTATATQTATPEAVTSLELSPSSQFGVVGSPVTFTVTAKDILGNAVLGFSGPVTLDAGDATAPTILTLVNGTKDYVHAYSFVGDFNTTAIYSTLNFTANAHIRVPTATPTPTLTATHTPTDTATDSATPTPSDTATSTATNTGTSTATDSPTATASSTPTDTATSSATATATDTATSTATSTATRTATNTTTSTATDSATETATDSATSTATGTATMTPTATATSTATKTGTSTATESATATPTDTGTSTDTSTATSTATRTATSTATATATGTGTDTATATPTDTYANSPTNTATATATSTATDTGTSTATRTPTSTATPTATDTGTATPTATATSSATSTASGTATSTVSSTPTPTITDTPTTTPTFTPGGSVTNTPTQALSGLGKVVLAPVPVAAGTPVCLYAEKPVASSQWTIVNFVGESVASLSFGAVSLPCWDTTGVPAGLYLVRLTIAYGDGSTATSWHKVVVTP